MTRELHLNGEWELTYTTPSDPGQDWGRWITATVPGDVRLDLMRAGLIGEPLVGENSKNEDWLEEKDWWYRRDFEIEPGFLGERVELVCEGLDLSADLYLNGERVGGANNMFVAHRFDVTEHLRAGLNELRVRVDVGLRAAQGKTTAGFEKSWSNQEPLRPWLRKAQQAFYWDTAPRLLTCGIWRPMRLESFGTVALRDVLVQSELHGSGATLSVDVELENVTPGRCAVTVQAEVEGIAGAIRSLPVEVAPGAASVGLTLPIPEPQLWWPNGLGEAHLYRVTVRLLDARAALLGERLIRHGVRTVELEQRDLGGGERSFTFVVNGVRVFAKGGNWVPSDAVFARTGGPRERRLLELAHAANFNMLRVWGGGIYPDAAFYDACDELGLLVWQDFMFACGYYPDFDPEFVAGVRCEAELIVRACRNHAALALWCGNNETYDMHERVNPQGVFYGQMLYESVLPEVCARLDPKTPYHRSSPYPTTWEAGDHHVWEYSLGLYLGQPKAMRLWDYTEINHKFVSEFGVFAPSNPASVHKFMGTFPAVVNSPVYNHHRNHFEAGFIDEMLRRFYKPGGVTSPEEWVVAGQMSQAEVVKFILEEFRSRMFVCSGTLFWEYNDSWGHVGYAPVDYYLSLKPLYHYMRRAYAPVHAVFRDLGRELWVLNDTLHERTLEVEHGAMTFSGAVVWSDRMAVVTPPAGKALVARLDAALTQVADPRAAFAFARVFEGGTEIDRNRQFLVPIEKVRVPPSTLTHEVEATGPLTWQVRLSSPHFAWMVKLDSDDDLRYSDNAFDLWPGEAREVTVRGGRPRLRLRVTDMNQFATPDSPEPKGVAVAEGAHLD